MYVRSWKSLVGKWYSLVSCNSNGISHIPNHQYIEQIQVRKRIVLLIVSTKKKVGDVLVHYMARSSAAVLLTVLDILFFFCGESPDSRVHGANMGPIWGRQDPGGPHVGPMNFAIFSIIVGSENVICLIESNHPSIIMESLERKLSF